MLINNLNWSTSLIIESLFDHYARKVTFQLNFVNWIWDAKNYSFLNNESYIKQQWRLYKSINLFEMVYTYT